MVTNAWYNNSCWIKWLWPFSLIYKALFSLDKLRSKHSAHASEALGCPIVVVGNITLGGTGKTPVTLYLIDQLRSAGINLGVVSRGYLAKCNTFPHLVRDQDTAGYVGDEPKMIFDQTGVPVVISPNRVQATKKLLELSSKGDCPPVDLILSDDGLQHHRLPRDIEIVVLDGARGVGNGLLLPAGPCRETTKRLNSVDHILINASESNDVQFLESTSTYLNYSSFSLKPQSWFNLMTGEVVDIETFEICESDLALAGIGNPQRFFSTITALGGKPKTLALADHEAPSAALLAKYIKSSKGVKEARFLMTSKDAVKCRETLKSNTEILARCWALNVEVSMKSSESRALIKLITDKINSLQTLS